MSGLVYRGSVYLMGNAVPADSRRVEVGRRLGPSTLESSMLLNDLVTNALKTFDALQLE